MRKLQLLTLILALVLPLFLQAQFTYLEDPSYQRLTGPERQDYIRNLEREMENLQQRRTTAIENTARFEAEIPELRRRIAELDVELAEIMQRMGITEQDIADMRTRLQYYKDQLTNWERMSDDELWRNAKAFTELREDYNRSKTHRLSRLPEFQRDFTDLDRRFTAIQDTMNRSRRSSGYHEDSYTVRRGDTLSRISGYDFIYNDPTRGGVIYRANRDQMRSQSDLREGQTLKIPRGLPVQWKVHTGESLWRISQYPEVYGTGKRWPVIYRANRDQIKNPDLIYPNQVFVIPRDDAPPPSPAQTVNLVGIWKAGNEGQYTRAAGEFTRGIPDETVYSYGYFQFRADGTFSAMKGTFRYDAPSPRNVNHDNFVEETEVRGTYRLNGNSLTIEGEATIRDLQRALGNSSGARPAVVKDESRTRPVNETINLSFSSRTVGQVSGFSHSSGPTTTILTNLTYEKH